MTPAGLEPCISALKGLRTCLYTKEPYNICPLWQRWTMHELLYFLHHQILLSAYKTPGSDTMPKLQSQTMWADLRKLTPLSFFRGSSRLRNLAVTELYRLSLKPPNDEWELIYYCELAVYQRDSFNFSVNKPDVAQWRNCASRNSSMARLLVNGLMSRYRHCCY